MKALRIITIISVSILFISGYFYHKNELNYHTENISYVEKYNDSIILIKDKKIDHLNSIIESGDTLHLILIDSLSNQLRLEKNKFKSFELESKFKYQKLVTEKSKMRDDIDSLKSDLVNLRLDIKDKDKKIFGHRRTVKLFEFKIDSLIEKLETNEFEPELQMMMEIPSDSLEILPEIKIDEDKGRKRKKKKSL